MSRASKTADTEFRAAKLLFASAIITALIAATGGVTTAVLSQKDGPVQSCPAYWEEIGDLVKEGRLSQTTYRRLDDPELEQRCGEAHDIASDYEPASGPEGQKP